MLSSVIIRNFLIYLCFCISVFGENLILLTNKNVSLSKKLALKYSQFTKNPKENILEFSLTQENEISHQEFLDFAKHLKKVIGKKELKGFLTFYGIPQFVVLNKRKFLFDELLMHFRHPKLKDVQFSFNNPFYKKVIHTKNHQLPVLVSRLDGPNQQTVIAILARWELMRKIGFYRRILLNGIQINVNSLKDEGFTVHVDKGIEFPLDEIQWMNLPIKFSESFLAAHQNKTCAPGAWIQIQQLTENKISIRTNNALSELLLLRPSHVAIVQEQYFDYQHFFQRLQNSEGLVSAWFGSLKLLNNNNLLIADPLYIPLLKETLEEEMAYYQDPKIPRENQKALFFHQQDRNWWNLKQILKSWSDGEFNLALGKLEWSILKAQQNDIFYEAKLRCLWQLGRDSEINEVIEKWEFKSKNWYFNQVKSHYSKLTRLSK